MLRSMLTMRPLPRNRFVFAARSGLCMGVPVLVGWFAGDLMAGMMAATGGFTALYGRGRPYRSRAVELALVALAFALVVAIGNAVSSVGWAVVPTVAVIAMVSTWLGNALRIGPPGAYMFMMACAAATAMPAGHINPAEAFVLVLVGGGFAWIAHMAGALVRPRGPEERAVVAAAVLMLHQGREWLGMLQRSIERVVGTWAGLLLAGAVLWNQPRGPWLALLIAVAQFTVEMLVLRNYALAVVFITVAALTLATGGLPIDDLRAYLMARGVDTAVGCAVALVVFKLVWPRASAALIPEELAQTLSATLAVAEDLAGGDVASAGARQRRRELQHRTFALSEAYRRATAASREPREAAERLWPAVVAAEELAFRVLTACWAIERLGSEEGRPAAASMFGAYGLAALRQALDDAGRALSSGAVKPLPAGLPGFLEKEVAGLHRALESASA